MSLRHNADEPFQHAPHFLTHCVMGYSMLYVYLVPTVNPSAASGMTMGQLAGPASDVVWLSPLFIVLLGSAAWELDQSHRLTGFAVSPLEEAGLLVPSVHDEAPTPSVSPQSNTEAAQSPRTAGGRIAPRSRLPAMSPCA